jgi:hypothetical protein
MGDQPNSNKLWVDEPSIKTLEGVSGSRAWVKVLVLKRMEIPPGSVEKEKRLSARKALIFRVLKEANEKLGQENLEVHKRFRAFLKHVLGGLYQEKVIDITRAQGEAGADGKTIWYADLEKVVGEVESLMYSDSRGSEWKFAKHSW